MNSRPREAQRRRAAFLDRDGVLNERPPEHEYVRSAEAFRWLPGACEAVRRLNGSSYVPIVVSNQRGIARGLVDRQAVDEIEQRIQRDLRQRGGSIADFYYCPHDIDEACACRKPAPGLLIAAAEAHHLDLARSVMIGDSESDVEAGRAAGCGTIRIAEPDTSSEADLVVASLESAVERLLLEC
jgi:D-glycero-D-manno-heptose 1,7-bisphosphate phosphatase